MANPTLEGTMPSFDPDRFPELAMQFFAELGAPWPSPAPPTQVTENVFPYGEDPQAEQTIRRWADGNRSITLTRTVHRDAPGNSGSTNRDVEGRVEGLADGVVLEVEGTIVRGYRFLGPEAAARAIEERWIRFYERVFRESLQWHEHPAIPREWLDGATAPGFLKSIQYPLTTYLVSVTDLFGGIAELTVGGAAWLLRGSLPLYRPPGTALWMLGPVPRGRRRECCLVMAPPAGGSEALWPVEPDQLAELVLGHAVAWTLAHDGARVIFQGQLYGPVRPTRDGTPDLGSEIGQPDTTTQVGRERSRIWRHGDRIMRLTEFRSDVLPDSFNVAIQSVLGGRVALFAYGHARAKPGQRETDSPLVRLLLLAPADAEIEPAVAALAQHVEAAGWTQRSVWNPPSKTQEAERALERASVEANAPPRRLQRARAPRQWTEDEIRRIDALKMQLGAALRAGGRYRYGDGDSNWAECVFAAGKFVLTSGYYADNTTQPTLELEDDDHALVDYFAGAFHGAGQGKHAIDALEAALRSVFPPKGIATPPAVSTPAAQPAPKALSREEIPETVLAEAPKRARRAEELLAALSKSSGVWLDLTRGQKEFFLYLRRDDSLGWHGIFLDEKVRVTGVSPWSSARARSEVEQTISQEAEAGPVASDAAVIARVAEIRVAAESALARLRGGEAWASGTPLSGQIVCDVGGSFVWALTSAEGGVTNVVEREESRVFEDLLKAYAAGRAPNLTPLTQERRDEIAMKADPSRYAELLRQGKLYVGGGTTTDMQWSISYRDDQYVRSYGDGFAVHEERVDESYVLDVLANRRYGWVRFPTRP